MKKLLLFIPILIMSFMAIAQKKTVAKNADGGWFYRNGGFPAAGGDTVLLNGDYAYIEIRNLQPAKPIYFIGNGNRVGIKANNSMIISNCRNLVFDGLVIGGPNDTTYNDQGFNMQGSDNIEIRNCVLQNSKVGFFTNMATGHYPNIFIHHNTIRNISDKARSNFSEAFYIGNTSGYPLTQTSYPNLRIEDNYLSDIGGDGIQIANGINVSVKRNRMRNIGFHKINDQWFSYLCGGGTSGVFEDNYTEKGTGTPFQILGTGEVVFRNNTAVNCAQGDRQDGFYIRQSFPTLKVRLIGNKIDKVNRSWITQVTPGLVIEDKGNVFGGTVTIPVEPPAATVPKAQYDSLLAKYQVALQLLSTCVSLREECYQKNKELNLTIDFLNTRVAELEAWIKETKNYINRP